MNQIVPTVCKIRPTSHSLPFGRKFELGVLDGDIDECVKFQVLG